MNAKKAKALRKLAIKLASVPNGYNPVTYHKVEIEVVGKFTDEGLPVKRLVDVVNPIFHKEGSAMHLYKLLKKMVRTGKELPCLA